MLEIEFEEYEAGFIAMAKMFDILGEKALYQTHYELADKIDDYSAEEWRRFLTDPRVAAKLNEEMLLIESIKRRALMQDIDTTKSPGKAALVKTMMDKEEHHKSKKKTGPVFIYGYILPNEEEKHAANITRIETDPFEVEL